MLVVLGRAVFGLGLRVAELGDLKDLGRSSVNAYSLHFNIRLA